MCFFQEIIRIFPKQLLEYSEDKNMLKAISDYAKTADLGIQDMHFEFDSKKIKDDVSWPDNIPEGIRTALVQFMHALTDNSMNSNVSLKVGEVSAKACHFGENRDGQQSSYMLELEEESDGTRKLMALAPAIESALRMGGILLVDELERDLHPKLVNFYCCEISKQNYKSKRRANCLYHA